jgi:hypothetical protein
MTMLTVNRYKTLAEKNIVDASETMAMRSRRRDRGTAPSNFGAQKDDGWLDLHTEVPNLPLLESDLPANSCDLSNTCRTTR